MASITPPYHSSMSQASSADFDERLQALVHLDWNGGPEFPVPPQAVIEFSRLARTPDVRLDDLSRVVECEPGLTTQLLRSVNSSVFGFRQKVESVPQSIALLGIGNCTSILLTKALDRSLKDFESQLISNFDAKRETRERARFAREIAARIGLDPVLSFTAATLQDILLPLLTSQNESEYRRYLNCDDYPGIEEFERDTFGWTHAELTAKVLLEWGFPRSLIVRVLMHHCSPEELFVADGPLSEVTPNATAALLSDTLQQSPSGVARLVDLQRFHPRMKVLEIADVVDRHASQSVNTPTNNLPLVTRIQSAMLDQIERRRKDSIVPGRQFGNYVLEEKLTESAMAEVFRARHITLRRPAAIKFLKADRINKESIQQFEREVQLTSNLCHPNTISVFDFGHTVDDLFYYAMEYIDGLTLSRMLNFKGPVDDSRVLNMLLQACGSLAEAHSHGLVHRDIKPQNLMISEGVGYGDRITVLDFGLVSDTQLALKNGAAIRGTPLYMSPEAAACDAGIDGRSDLYSLAAVAYFLLTGQTVFEGSVSELLAQHLQSPPIEPSQRTKNPISPCLERLLMECLHKDPNERPGSAMQLAERLASCQTDHQWSQQDSEDWWRSYRRHPISTTPEALDQCAETIIGPV